MFKISNKTMRKKDFVSLKNKKPGFKSFFIKDNPETLYRTPRGWFFHDKPTNTITNISVVDAQHIINLWGINYQTGW